MSYSISIKLKKAEGEYDPAASKFFGDPVISADLEEVINEFEDEVMFFGQINLADIAELDRDGRLPHTGRLYFFIDTACYPYAGKVLYSEGEPSNLIEDYNTLVPDFERFTVPYLMSFELADENADGTKLFGNASSSEMEEADVLLQFDPLDNDTGFMDHINGYCYFTFEDADNLDAVDFTVIDS